MSSDCCIALGQKSLGTCWDLKLTLIQVLRGVAIVNIAPWKRCWTCFLWVNVLVDLHGCSNLNELLLPTELVSMIEGSKWKEYNGLVSSQLFYNVHMTSQHFLSESLCLKYEYTDIWLGTIGATPQHPPQKKGSNSKRRQGRSSSMRKSNPRWQLKSSISAGQRSTLHETNSSHLKIGHPKSLIIFQPLIFRGKLLVPGRVDPPKFNMKMVELSDEQLSINQKRLSSRAFRWTILNFRGVTSLYFFHRPSKGVQLFQHPRFFEIGGEVPNKNSLEHGDGFVICFSLLFLDVIWMSLVQLNFVGILEICLVCYLREIESTSYDSCCTFSYSPFHVVVFCLADFWFLWVIFLRGFQLLKHRVERCMNWMGLMKLQPNLQDRPLPVVNGVITPINGLIIR